jgi:hypothetical protein
MASPHVAGGAALLKERHPDWTVAQIKSALVLTGTPVRDDSGREISVLREGGGQVNLPRADNPLVFAAPTNVTFPVNGGARPVALTDAGGGAGTWTVTTQIQGRKPAEVQIAAPPTVTVPGSLAVSAEVSDRAGSRDVTGFFVLTRGADSRRIPFWLEVDHPLLGTERTTPLSKSGLYTGTTRHGASKVSRYRYPTGGDVSYPGPEVVYRIHVVRPLANFGVAVVSGHAVPHVVFAGDENHLVGYAGLPQALNPYLKSFGETRPVAGSVLPAPGTYDIVFDTRSASSAGRFQFRFWKNDVTPPTIRVVSARHGLVVAAVADGGAGVDPRSISATIDGHIARTHFANGKLTFRAEPGSHEIVVTASDYQELKNMEDVTKIKPNTATLTRAVVVS